MITTHKGRTYEIFLGGTLAAPTYYAHTHCKCGSTFGSGEWLNRIEDSIAVAESSVIEHERAGKHVKSHPCPWCIVDRPTANCPECGGRGVVLESMKPKRQ